MEKECLITCLICYIGQKKYRFILTAFDFLQLYTIAIITSKQITQADTTPMTMISSFVRPVGPTCDFPRLKSFSSLTISNKIRRKVQLMNLENLRTAMTRNKKECFAAFFFKAHVDILQFIFTCTVCSTFHHGPISGAWFTCKLARKWLIMTFRTRDTLRGYHVHSGGTGNC